MGLIPAGAYANREYLKSVEFHSAVPVNLQDLLFDPQTSGGLLVACAPSQVEAVLRIFSDEGFAQAVAIGTLEPGTPGVDVLA